MVMPHFHKGSEAFRFLSFLHYFFQHYGRANLNKRFRIHIEPHVIEESLYPSAYTLESCIVYFCYATHNIIHFFLPPFRQ